MNKCKKCYQTCLNKGKYLKPITKSEGYVTETILKSTQIYQGYILECDFVLKLILNID